jgi:hypothetical protein
MMDQQVTLDPRELPVEPGGEAVCGVQIKNRGTRVDEFTASILGPAAQWAAFEEPSIRLFPGQDGVITVSFRPPRSHLLVPGPVTFGVRVVPTSAGEESSVVEEGTLDVARFSEVVAVMIPRRSRGRLAARHRLSITNRGNVPATVALTALDPDGALRFRFRPERVETAPGATEYAGLRVKPLRRLLTAPTEFHSFDVAVRPAEAPPVQLQASMEQRRLIPRWLPVALLAVTVLLIALFSLRAHTANPVSLAVVGVPTPTAAPAGPAGAAAAPAGGGKSVAAKPPPVPAAVVAPTTPGPCPPPGEGGHRTYYAADGNAVDSGGAQHDGVLQNGAGFTPGAVGGPSDQAFNLPTGNASVDLGSPPGALGADDFCVSLNVKTVQPSPAALLGNRDAALSPGHWWDLRMLATGEPSVELDNSASGGGSVVLSAARRINDGRWHIVTVARVGTLVNLYVDGALAQSDFSGAVIDVTNRARTRLGSDGFLPFVGALDDVVISHG